MSQQTVVTDKADGFDIVGQAALELGVIGPVLFGCLTLLIHVLTDTTAITIGTHMMTTLEVIILASLGIVCCIVGYVWLKKKLKA